VKETTLLRVNILEYFSNIQLTAETWLLLCPTSFDPKEYMPVVSERAIIPTMLKTCPSFLERQSLVQMIPLDGASEMPQRRALLEL
jgi:hypothetical protein